MFFSCELEVEKEKDQNLHKKIKRQKTKRGTGGFFCFCVVQFWREQWQRRNQPLTISPHHPHSENIKMSFLHFNQQVRYTASLKMEPHVSLSWVEALLIHRLVSKDRPVSSQANRLTPAWLIRSNSRFLRAEAWNERNAHAKTPLLMKLAQKKKKHPGERAALSLHTPQNSWKPIQVSGAIPKRRLWSSEESWDSQVIM